MLNGKLATIFGGTGFIGRYVVAELAKQGYTMRVATRDPAAAGFLRPKGVVGQISPYVVRLRDAGGIEAAIDTAHLVVNLLGVLAPTRRAGFEFMHAEVPGRIARAAADNGAHMIHVSAIGADAQSKSEYARSKAHGEAAVEAAHPNAAIVRPSIVFGPEDEFFNRFAHMAALVPVLPLIGGGKTRFQPVYVGDVAAAIASIVKHEKYYNETWELGGPVVFTFRQLMELMLRETGQHALLLPLPFAVASFQARFLELVPGKPLTRDQVELLKHDNVTDAARPGLRELGVEPTALELVLPTYLDRFRKGGRFHAGPHEEKLYS